ncbi:MULTISPECIES: transglycosylase domain-containing protein [Streptomyces]|uniref:transglycosylase domain-containing protein n=1 Tax=Streptomyces TaxID=1883 RepID=UPI001CC9B526|nr:MULTISPECIES: transglycosylase domain-containing protein [Streptomyces]UBI40789.1 penicillin-binding protein [Streptomyces mobaraensis]
MIERRKGAHARKAAAPAGLRRLLGTRQGTARRLGRWLRPAYPRPGRSGWRRWVPSWRQTLGLIFSCVGVVTGLLAIMYARTEIPADLNAFATQQDNVYYWADGTEMARTGEVNRQDLPLGKVPEKVRWAALAAENETFYSDSGVSPSGMLRAVTKMITGGSTQGGSTITQQYVKNAYLNQEQTFSRKLSEMFIAIKLDRKLSKDEILEQYLNTSWYGRGTYGIARAAHAYYDKDVSELNASEGAFLASLLKGAALYDPAVSAKNHERAVERWNWVLDRMVAIGKLSKKERASYTRFPEPVAPPHPSGLAGQTGYLVETARAYVSAHSDVSDQDFARGGYQIHTTFDRRRVEALAKAVSKARATLGPDPDHPDRDLRIGAASVTTDGRITALYGGEGYLKQGFNDANSSVVPAGSAFTPFVYAAALRDGVQRERGEPRTPVTPATLYDGDDKISLMTPEGPYWDRSGKIVKAENDNGKSWGKITLKNAVAQSVNTSMMQLGMDVGLDRVGKVGVETGLLESSLGEKLPSFSLGTSTPSAIRMADAYATFAAEGRHTDPYSVSGLRRNGADVPVERPKPRQALPAPVAKAVDDALREAVRHGTALAAKAAGPGTAGKTGTAQDAKSAWFVGYRGGLSTAVSLARIDPKSQELLPLDGGGDGKDKGDKSKDKGKAKGGGGPSPASVPLGIWTRYMTGRS